MAASQRASHEALCRQRRHRTESIFDAQLAQSAYLAADILTIADITAKVALDFCMAYNNIEISEELTAFHRWNREIGERSSFAA